MYAIVDIAGQQYKVEKDQKVFVNRLEGEEGSKVNFDQVYLVDDNGKVQVGTPVVEDTVVSASIVSHLKGDKVQVFHKKRRKGYQKQNGHRQSLTEILIEGIGAGKAKAAPAKKAAAKEETAEAKPAAKEAAPKKEEGESKPKAAAKKPAAKKTTAAAADKKPAAKKAAPKAKKADEKKSEE